MGSGELFHRLRSDQEPPQAAGVDDKTRHESSVDRVTSQGQSALHVTAAACMLEGVLLLLRAGGASSQRDTESRTPLHLVCLASSQRNGATVTLSSQAQCAEAMLTYGTAHPSI